MPGRTTRRVRRATGRSRAASPEQSAKVVGDHPSLGVVAESRKLSKQAELAEVSTGGGNMKTPQSLKHDPLVGCCPDSAAEFAGGSQSAARPTVDRKMAQKT